jgi:dimethylhistidine N-methyltransferase
MNQFYKDILEGLQSSPKYLPSKYFYDKKGDELFQQIMACEEYYLTNCEMEIFTQQNKKMADVILEKNSNWDVIEFGPGDAVKSKYLLEELINRNGIATYFPIDISENIIHFLNESLSKLFPSLSIYGLNGDYLEMLPKANEISSKPKLILFLGANIGNFKFHQTQAFCAQLASQLSAGDLVMIGFDLKKNPAKILAAYNDSSGYTRQFNLNLLHRMNTELDANFNINQFEHYAMYDPDTGACKSYLVSLKDQTISFGDTEFIHFLENETIFMEVSQKFALNELDEIAFKSGFTPKAHFFDSQKYFVDVVWECK